MPRLIHLARASQQRSIERTGLRGARRSVLNEGKQWVEHRNVLYTMPMTPDFAVTYQWVRELRRWHDERLIAVHVRLPSDEEVLVGRYHLPHLRMPLGEAIRRLVRAPEGNEIVVLRPVRASEVVRIQEINQRVGWIESPEQHGKSDCLCSACVPHGARDLMRRVRGAMDVQLMAARKATSPDTIAEALQRMHTPLERAKGRYPIDKLVAYFDADSARVRQAAASLLAHFPWGTCRPLLERQLTSDDFLVRHAALIAAISSGGVSRAFALLSPNDSALLIKLMEYLAYSGDAERGARILLAIGKLDAKATREQLLVILRTVDELLGEEIRPFTRDALNQLVEETNFRLGDLS